jgi:hypothetical protein
MSLMLLLVAPAFADRVYWLSPPDEVSAAAVARTLPGATSAPLDALVTGGVPTILPDAIDRLREELGEVRPLLQEFDGELQIMARLAKASEDVQILRSEEERNLLRRALLFQGFAVHRYFQDRLGSERAAAPYRVGTGAEAHVAPWLEACALLAAPLRFAEEDIPEPTQRIAWDATQAYCQSMPSATFVIGALAQGAELRIDGVRIDAGAGTRVRVMPGRHLFHIAVGDVLLMAAQVRLKPGADAILNAPFGPTELEQLRLLISAGGEGWNVPPAAQVPIEGAEEPVYAAIPNGERTTLVRLDGGVATRVALRAAPRAAVGAGPAVYGRAALGGGWVSTGDFFLQNLDDGAIHDRYTVNAGAPAASVSVGISGRYWSVGAGLDAALTVGDYHSLPTGDVDTNVFLYPHVAAGLPWVQVSAGPLLPWYVGLGGRAHVPLVGPLELFATGLYGVPIDRPRENGQPTFEPLPLYAAWGGVAARVGGAPSR